MSSENNQAIEQVRKVSAALQTVDGVDRNDTRGKENIDTDDVVLPFLAICQKTSPQLEADSPKFIDGIRFLDMFNSLTSERYGQGPVEFIPIVLKKHAIEFNPYESGGGIKDRNVPWDDDRCQFHDEDKPVATRFYDWAVLIVPTMELIILSFKGTGISVAKQFQQIVNLRSGPAFAGKYRLTSAKGTSNGNAFGKFAVQPAGKPTPEEFEFASVVYENIKGKNLVTDHEAEREPGSDDLPSAQTSGTKAPF